MMCLLRCLLVETLIDGNVADASERAIHIVDFSSVGGSTA